MRFTLAALALLALAACTERDAANWSNGARTLGPGSTPASPMYVTPAR